MSEPKDLESLLARVTERRRELLTSVVNRRTRHFCMVLEDLFDPHNIFLRLSARQKFSDCRMCISLKKTMLTV